MSKALARMWSSFILGAAAVATVSGCTKATQSQLLPESSSVSTAARVRNASAIENVIHSFGGGSGSMRDGATPMGGLLDLNGTFYGTTTAGAHYARPGAGAEGLCKWLCRLWVAPGGAERHH